MKVYLLKIILIVSAVCFNKRDSITVIDNIMVHIMVHIAEESMI